MVMSNPSLASTLPLKLSASGRVTNLAESPTPNMAMGDSFLAAL